LSGPRLLLVLTEFPPSYGGMQTHAVHLCRRLHQRAYRISVATYRGDDQGTDARLPFPVHRSLSRIGYWENIRLLGSLARSFRADLVYASTVFFGQLREVAGVPMLCRSPGNDVLRPWIAWPFPWLSRALSTHWFEDLLYRRYRHLEWPERVEALLLERRRAAMRQSAGLMSRVLANSDYTAGLLDSLGLGPERVRVVAGGVDAKRFFPAFGDRRRLRARLGLPADAYILMTACRLVAKKGIDLLLGAFAELRHRMRDAHLVIAGDGRDQARCQGLAASLGVESAVTFAGRVPHARLHPYYWCADQFVLASREHIDPRTGLRDVETMGRVLCEANAAGVPAVAARSGGIPSVISHGANGLLFGEGRAGELVEHVQRLRDDAMLRARLRENGLRAAATLFDWSVISDAHEAEFRNML
jgi:glycosyltransferase involved in cell wall biosynthesis